MPEMDNRDALKFMVSYYMRERGNHSSIYTLFKTKLCYPLGLHQSETKVGY